MNGDIEIELVGGPRDGRRQRVDLHDGAPPPGLQHQVMSSLAQTLDQGQCLIGAARYRRRAGHDADGVWRYDYDPDASTGGLAD